MKNAFWIVAAVNVVSITCAPAAEKPTAEQLLAEYQKSVEKISRFRIDTLEKQWTTGSSDERIKNNKNGYVGITEHTIYHDDLRWRFSTIATLKFTLRGVSQAHKSGLEYLVGDYLNQRQALRVQWFTSPEDPTEIAKLAVSIENPLEEPRRFMGPSAIIFGHTLIDGDQPLWDVMRRTGTLELLPEMELAGGKPTYVVKSRGQFGQHVLWLDPKSGGLPRRIEIHKLHGDLSGDTRLGVEIAAPASRRLPLGFPKKRVLDEQSQSWYGIQIEDKHGIFVITAFNSNSHTSRRKDDKEEKEQHRMEYRTTTVELDPATWPPNAFLPGIEIPNGTNVATKNHPASFVWIDGRVEKKE